MSDTIEKAGYTAKLEQDDCLDNPRTAWDNASKMVCFHRRHNLGDEQDEYKQNDYNSWAELEKAIIKREKPATILPLYLMDHSGITIRVGSSDFSACDPQGWDWGQVGFAYVPKNSPDLKGLRGAKARERAEAIIRDEVGVYDQYLTGDVWSVLVEDPEGEPVASCGGFFGYGCAVEEAQRMLDEVIAEKGAQQCDPVAV